MTVITEDKKDRYVYKVLLCILAVLYFIWCGFYFLTNSSESNKTTTKTIVKKYYCEVIDKRIGFKTEIWKGEKLLSFTSTKLFLNCPEKTAQQKFEFNTHISTASDVHLYEGIKIGDTVEFIDETN